MTGQEMLTNIHLGPADNTDPIKNTSELHDCCKYLYSVQFLIAASHIQSNQPSVKALSISVLPQGHINQRSLPCHVLLQDKTFKTSSSN